jgi:hypothetical protein
VDKVGHETGDFALHYGAVAADNILVLSLSGIVLGDNYKLTIKRAKKLIRAKHFRPKVLKEIY